MKFLIDMNLTPRWCAVLQAAGHEASHWSQLGAMDAPDTELMEYAHGHNLVVLTHDLDFSAILAATKGLKPSVVQIRADNVSPEVIGAAVIDAIRQVQLDLEAGALLTIDTQRSRLRLLPLT
ncbi:DUF5615 family PIN-like protein [Asticcacaulis sp. BYS171W]|uniref:DUF5615 family PIN-like protein n=1 Tax=Asticcacaulis aquaticus TaxID=2984212 RepID=A0ABT5HX29_9CAUL|nr:DUF5615 family PIN-like protein [Asticcacaulis aquaticus]MDC7683991.1 DUF5615 family PIN-like protein [Asticcacaulis aquaticus]